MRLDDCLPRYLSGVPADKRKITVRQLFAHRSGLPEYSSVRDFEGVSPAGLPPRRDDEERLLRRTALAGREVAIGYEGLQAAARNAPDG